MRINVHAGHNPDGKIACGAVGLIRESTEARKVKDAVISQLRQLGHTVYDCTCENGASQSDVLAKIVNACNSHNVDLDVSIHFNAGAGDNAGNGRTTGTEVLVYDTSGRARQAAERVCACISSLGFRNRGVKVNKDLYVLRKTKAPAMLVECCFVDDKDDVQLYDCQKMAGAIVFGITGQLVKVEHGPTNEKGQKGDSGPQGQAEAPSRNQSQQKMVTGQAGIDLIKQFEGCRLEAYRCAAGVWTIGYGHTAGVKQGQRITAAQAESYLRADLQKYEKKVDKYAAYNWNQNEFDALVSFAYNIGSIDQLTAGGTRSRAEIAENMLYYNKAAGKVLAGLTRRRQSERQLFLKGCQGTASPARQPAAGTPESRFATGMTYTLQANMFVRDSAGGAKKKYTSLTANAKSHAIRQADGAAVLKKGTAVTCKGTENVGGAVWMRIPSGYVCAVGDSGEVYIR